jgi:hypothetical protein
VPPEATNFYYLLLLLVVVVAAVVMEIEPRDPHVLSTCSTTELHQWWEESSLSNVVEASEMKP